MTRHTRGAALLLVMWLILLLSGLVAGYAMTARIESLQGNGLARSVAAGQVARAGIEIAVSRLVQADPALRWPADTRFFCANSQLRSFSITALTNSGLRFS